MMIEDFIAYVSRYAPEFARQIEGAAEDEIARLQQLAKLELPTMYRQFLQYMGRNASRIELLNDCSTNIADVIDYYEGMQTNPRITVPDHCILITECVFDGCELYLNTASKPEPQVVGKTGPNQTRYYAFSLLALLYNVAFRTYRQEAHVFQEYNSSYEDVGRRFRLPEAQAMAQPLFAREWFSDTHDYCGEGGEASLYLRQFEYGSGLYMKVAARTEKEVESIALPFAQQFNLRAFVSSKL